MVRTGLVLLILSLLFVSSSGSVDESKSASLPDISKLPVADVVSVIDGNTLKLNFNGEEKECRLANVDTPKMKNAKKPVYYNRESSMFLNNLIAGEQFSVESESSKVDKEGKLLIYLYRVSDGLCVNSEIIRQGYGKVVNESIFGQDRVNDLLRYQENAKKAEKGLWYDPDVYMTKSGKTYHREDKCGRYNLVKRNKLSEVQGEYNPCKTCDPLYCRFKYEPVVNISESDNP